MADISKITIPNGSGTNTYDLKDSEAREGLLSTVKYTEQSLTTAQQAQARENIGAAASTDIPTDAVKYTEQTLTDAQKTQARTNIGAGTSDFSGDYRNLTNAPPLAINGGGAGGDIIGGTGVNKNSTKYTNSVAYGAFASAVADHAIAFGNWAFAGSNYGGKHAVAIGNHVRATRDYEWAIGKFNQSNADTAFAYGDGTSDGNPHNLMELKTDGTLLLNGNAVKTEGEDNKLRLGQIWGMKFSAGNSANHLPAYGFAELCKKNSPSTNYVKYVTFSSDDTATIESSLYVYQLGDFVGYITSPTSSAASVSVKVQPLRGRTLGKPTTGKWIKVESCYVMFQGCREITSLDLSMFDTSKVENMAYMFRVCVALTSLDLSGFDTSNVKTMEDMFLGCTALETLDISSFDMSNVIEYTDMFKNDTALTTLKTPKINPHDDIALPRTLYSQDGTAYTNLPVTTGTSIELRQSWT